MLQSLIHVSIQSLHLRNVSSNKLLLMWPSTLVFDFLLTKLLPFFGLIATTSFFSFIEISFRI